MPLLISLSSSDRPSELAQALRSLPAGEHVCLIHEKDPEEQIPAVVPFLQQGLENGERVVYIADDASVEDVGRWLTSADSEVEAAVQAGSLLIWTRQEWLQPGELDSEQKAAQAQSVIAEAQELGFRGIRFAVEVDRALAPDIQAERLQQWESTINTFVAGPFPVRVMCQYNRSRLGASVVGAGLRSHPTVIIGEEICPNPYSEAPSLLEGASEDARVDWMLSQLQQAQASKREHDIRLAAAAVAARDEFLAILSHELRTPTTIILGTASLLKHREGEMTEAELQQTVDDTYDEALRLHLVVNGLLSLASPESAGAPILEPLLLNRLLAGVAEEFRATHGRIVEVIMADAMMVGGDVQSLQSLIRNLLSNADLYSPPKEPIGVELVDGGDGSCVTTVRDRGIGISDADFDQLFTPFFRSAGVRHLRGIGLGLALSARIVGQHGGRIWANQREGGGAAFSFSLPLLAE